jgi:hypothetical protein
MNTTMPAPLSLSSDGTTSHSTKPSQNDGKVDGYPPHAGERDKGLLRESHFKEAT